MNGYLRILLIILSIWRNGEVKYRWNVDPTDPITILRLISELEGVWNFLDCLDDAEDELKYIAGLKKKYYSLYFKMMRELKK